MLSRLAEGVRVDGEDVAQLELEIELVPRPSSVEVFRSSVGKQSSYLVKPCITSRSFVAGEPSTHRLQLFSSRWAATLPERDEARGGRSRA